VNNKRRNPASTSSAETSVVWNKDKQRWDLTTLSVDTSYLSAEQIVLNTKANSLASLCKKALTRLQERLDILEAPINVKIIVDESFVDAENRLSVLFTNSKVNITAKISHTKVLSETKTELLLFVVEQFRLMLNEFMILSDEEDPSVDELLLLIEM